ncbi:MAG: XTP/dITP diphosphatase [Eggerthellaceae bacterium]|nr:XTP/dITP diphosphatase [Eggerthellaceae bacterium]
MKTVVLATNNSNKAQEISEALDMEEWAIKTLKDLGLDSKPEETGENFEENARIKAKSAHEISGGMPSLADDSGLIVDALDGAPGVYSSRYAGEEGNDSANNSKLLKELEDVPDEQRSARFECTLVYIDENDEETVATGTIEGFIGREERGEEGFGYDPLFYPNEYEGRLTLAEISREEKSKISHRGNALRALKKKLLGK